MNILILTGKMQDGGAETHVYELARSLLEREHEVTLASAGGRLAAELCALGVSHIQLPLDSKLPWSVFCCIRKLKRLVKSRRFHVLHAHTRISAAVAYSVCRKTGLGFVSTVHARFCMKAPWRWLSRFGDKVIAVSHDLGQYLLESSNVLAENITVVPNGIDTEKFCRQNTVADGVFKIAFLSRLDSDCSEAAYSLCRIAPRLAERIGSVEIVIGGGGEELEGVTQTASQLNLGEGRVTVRVVGAVSDVPDFLVGADVFVGVSRAALEAMSCEIPTVIAGNEGFVGVLNGENLLSAAEENFCGRGREKLNDQNLLDSIISLWELDASQRETLGRLLREYVVAHHSVEQMTLLTEKVYSQAVNLPCTEKKGVLLCGYYGFGNMGDDLLLLRAVERAKSKYPRTPVRALTRRGRLDESRFRLQCFRRINPLSVMLALLRSKTVVFGGGTLLQNNTSQRSLWYYLALLYLSQKLGRQTELWGNGVGNIKGKLSRKMTARVLSRCKYVELRDKESFSNVTRLLSEYGYALPRISLEKDLAVAPVAVREGRVAYLLKEFNISESARIAVIAPRGASPREDIRRAEALLKGLRADGVLPVYVVMYPDEDMTLCKCFHSKYGGVMAYPIGASDVVGLCKRARVTCGMRYHALVLAHLAGAPFIGVGSDTKIVGFCKDYGGVCM